jgi:hypothetical protein
MNHDLKFACELIRKCESDLGYKLTDGNKRDLLADNRNDWTLEYIRRLVADAAKIQEHNVTFQRDDKAIYTNPVTGQKFNVVVFLPKAIGMPGFSVVWFGEVPQGDGQCVETKYLSHR